MDNVKEDIRVTFDSENDINTSLDNGSIQFGQLEIGTTTTGEAGTEAVVTNSGSLAHAILNFTIPKGKDGVDGVDGESGVYVGETEPTNANVWIKPSEGTVEFATKEYVDRAIGDIETLLGGI